MVPNINLLPELEKKSATPKLLYGVFIIAVAMILAYLIFMFFTAKGEIITLSEEEQMLTKKRDELQLALDVQLNENQGSLAQSVQFAESVSYPVTPLIDETRALLPAHSYLRNYEFRENTIHITVDFESMKDISKYVERLLTSAYFTDTQISDITNFEVQLGEQKELTPEEKFKQVPRYSVTITAMIDYIYLAGGRRS